MYLPVIGAVMEAGGTIIEKKILRNKRINFRNYTVFEFFSIFLMSLPFLYFVWRVDAEAFLAGNLIRFGFVIIISIFANLCIFYSLKRENITEFEPIWVMQPLFTILLAFLLYETERNWVLIVVALIASITLVLSHVKKHHLAFDRYIIAAVIGSFLFSVELVASKPLLPYYSPFTFYFIRCIAIFLIAFLIFRPSFKVLDKKSWIMVFAVGLIWVFYRAIVYYGYLTLGIVFTTTIFILSPVFMFLFAVFFLKEKPTIAQIVSTIVIVLCVVAAILVESKVF